MSTTASEAPDAAAELRQRAPHGSSGNGAGATTGHSTDHVPLDGDDDTAHSSPDKGKKTYGRTPDGTGKLC